MRKALMVVLILSAALSWAQGGCTGQKPLNGMTTGGFLKGVANASVRVCSDTLTPCTTIPLYSDAALTQSIANPVTTDATGNYQYCAATGSYNEQISGSGISGSVNNTPVTISGSGDVTRAGNNAFTGSNSHSGTETFSGSTTVPVVGTSAFQVAAWGDSLTCGAGGNGGPSCPNSGSYVAQLESLINLPVYNGGVAGETCSQIKTRMLADTAKHAETTVIWAGRNDVAVSMDLPGIEACIASMVAALSTPNYTVLSVLNSANPNESAGGSIYTQIIALNNDLAATYGSHYLDVRANLVAHYNPSIPQDVTDHTNDIPPSSLRYDAVHMNSAGYLIVAQQVQTKIANSGGQALSVASAGLLLANPTRIGSSTPNDGTFNQLNYTQLCGVNAIAPQPTPCMGIAANGSIQYLNLVNLIAYPDNSASIGQTEFQWKDGWFKGTIHAANINATAITNQPTNDTPGAWTSTDGNNSTVAGTRGKDVFCKSSDVTSLCFQVLYGATGTITALAPFPDHMLISGSVVFPTIADQTYAGALWNNTDVLKFRTSGGVTKVIPFSDAVIARAQGGTGADTSAMEAGCVQYPCKITSNDQTGKSANVSPVTLVASVPANAFYELSCRKGITQAATTSSTIPYCRLVCTDPTDSVSRTHFGSVSLANTNNNTAIGDSQVIGCYAKTGTAVTYDTAGYASSGATVMQYDVHAVLTRME